MPAPETPTQQGTTAKWPGVNGRKERKFQAHLRSWPQECYGCHFDEQASSDPVEHALQQGFRCRSRYHTLCPRAVHGVRLAEGLLTLGPVTRLAVANVAGSKKGMRNTTNEIATAGVEPAAAVRTNLADDRD